MFADLPPPLLNRPRQQAGDGCNSIRPGSNSSLAGRRPCPKSLDLSALGESNPAVTRLLYARCSEAARGSAKVSGTTGRSPTVAALKRRRLSQAPIFSRFGSSL